MNQRNASIERKTTETQIKLSINLDGSGQSNISTGIPQLTLNQSFLFLLLY